MNGSVNAPGGRTPWPSDPIAAATHPDPYPYYARLVVERPLYRDERLGVWVASSAAAVTDVLACNFCHVRPSAEPVPRTLLDSPAAEIFRHLVRMNDGPNHCPFKKAVVATLDGLDTSTALAAARQRAVALAETHEPHRDRAALNRYIFSLPVETTASLVGVPTDRLSDVARWVAAFVDGISPIADAADVARGKEAASHLLALFRTLLDEQRTDANATLLDGLAQQARCFGRAAEDVVIANGIGFMSQTYEATAGLIGNTLLALARQDDILASVRATPALLASVVDEVLLTDPPTHSTRRFVTRDGIVAGEEMRAGDAILVMLAAAGRDPAINTDPDRFDIRRNNRRILNFGSGVHACPASALAPLIAATAVARLMETGMTFEGLDRHASCKRSNHIRMPLFG